MFIGDIEETFEKFEGEYKKFEKVKDRLNHCRDIHAILLLQKITPIHLNAICFVEGGDVMLNLDMSDDKVLAKFTEELILELVRCGISYNSVQECLAIRFDV